MEKLFIMFFYCKVLMIGVIMFAPMFLFLTQMNVCLVWLIQLAWLLIVYLYFLFKQMK